jgi:DnaJ like chaperone protein
MALYIAIFFITLFVLYKFSGAHFYVAGGGKLSGENLNNVQDLFFRTVFTLLGYVAKRDGPVNDKEVKRTQTYMEKMDLDAAQKREAIRLFKVGAEPQFNADGIIKEFHGLAKKSPNLAQILLVYLINLARVDGLLVTKEVDAVHQVALGLGYSNIMFKHLLQMVTSQNKYSDTFSAKNASSEKNAKDKSSTAEKKSTQSSKSSSSRTDSKSSGATPNRSKPNSAENGEESCSEKTDDFNNRGDQLGAAYEVFDVPPSASDAEIKKAYRALVSQYHPDKLMGQGLPPYMIQSATECFQTIQAAYDYIKEARTK